MDNVLDCQFLRRFGVELELNTTDGMVKKLNEEEKEIPEGSNFVAALISRVLKSSVGLHGWHATHNNDEWIVKPDSSCGIEVCTPILKGWRGLKALLEVIKALNESKVTSDRRCSMHVHVNIGDLNMKQLASVIAYYIKCEHIFFDSLPYYRKNNRYCQFLGVSELFWDTFPMEPDEIINRVSGFKYYSLNGYHFVKGGGFGFSNSRKQTIEFRMAENEACLNPFFTKNWVRLLLHFVEVTKNLPLPCKYKKGDPWSGLLWLNPRDVFKVLRFDEPLSDGLRQVKEWFIGRILMNGYDNDGLVPLIWSNKGRAVARAEFLDMIKDYVVAENSIIPDDVLFGRKYIK